MIERIPIRARVAGLTTVAGLVASLTLASVALWRTGTAARGDLDEYLSQEASEALALVTNGGSFAELVDIASLTGPSQRLALYGPDGVVLDETPIPPPAPDLADASSRFENLTDPATGEAMRTIVVPFSLGSDERILVVASPLEYVNDRVFHAFRIVLPFAVLAAVVAGLGGYAISGLILRPVARLTESARDIARSASGRRLDVPPANDEIRRLAETLNAGLAAVEAVMEVHTEFVAAASHELRAPLARIAADIEYAQRPTRSQAEVAERLERLADHTHEMAAIANDLLDRLAHRDLPPTEVMEASDAVEVVLAHVEHLTTMRLAVIDTPDQASVVWDVGQVAGAVRNLLDNAFLHGAEPVGLTIEFTAHEATFSVDDAGPGIPPRLWDSVVRPFEGVAEAGPGGSTGLGLAIVSRVAHRHGGVLEFDEGPPFRTILRLPLFDRSTELAS